MNKQDLLREIVARVEQLDDNTTVTQKEVNAVLKVLPEIGNFRQHHDHLPQLRLHHEQRHREGRFRCQRRRPAEAVPRRHCPR